MGKNLEKVFAAAVEGDFKKMEQEIADFTSDFDSRPQLRYMGATRAADVGHQEKAAEYIQTIRVSDGDKTFGHFNMVSKYLKGEDGLKMDLNIIKNHLLDAKKGFNANPAHIDESTATTMIRNLYKKQKQADVQKVFLEVFSEPKWKLAQPMSTLELVLKKFEPYLLKDTNLKFTDDQMELMRRELDSSMTADEFSEIQTSFFNYFKLNDEFVSALWQYGLENCELENEVEEKKIVPFAALNTSGRGLDYGSNQFAETNNWGILALYPDKGSGSDCPVIWILNGDVHNWAESANSLEIR